MNLLALNSAWFGLSKGIENMEGNQDLTALESGGGLNQVAGSGFLKCI